MKQLLYTLLAENSILQVHVNILCCDECCTIYDPRRRGWQQ